MQTVDSTVLTNVYQSKSHCYILYRNPDTQEAFIQALCGTVGMYGMAIPLTGQETQRCLDELEAGCTEFMDDLANRLVYHPIHHEGTFEGRIMYSSNSKIWTAVPTEVSRGIHLEDTAFYKWCEGCAKRLKRLVRRMGGVEE